MIQNYFHILKYYVSRYTFIINETTTQQLCLETLIGPSGPKQPQ